MVRRVPYSNRTKTLKKPGRSDLPPQALKLPTLPVIKKLRKRKKLMAEQSYKSSLVKDARTGAFSRLDKLPEACLHFTFAEQGDA